MVLLEKINSPADLKNISRDDLPQLAEEIRMPLSMWYPKPAVIWRPVWGPSNWQLRFITFSTPPGIRSSGMSGTRRMPTNCSPVDGSNFVPCASLMEFPVLAAAAKVLTTPLQRAQQHLHIRRPWHGVCQRFKG